MKIKALKPFALFDGRSVGEGDEIDIETLDGKKLVKIGYAVPVSSKKVERAVVEPAETRDAD